MRSSFPTSAAALGVLAAVASVLVAAPPAVAADPRDVTADVLADRDVNLTGDTVVTVPAGTTTYDGAFRGQGTLTVRGGGTLVLTRDSDFTLPSARRRQVVRTQGGNHPYTTVSNPDPPAITVARGATLQYGTGKGTGLIGHFPYDTPGYRLNELNVRVDGTLRLSLTRTFNIGTISGSGLVTQPRNMWGTLDLAGTHPFSGVIDNGTGVAVGRPEFPVSLPAARAIVNQGSWIIDTPLNQTITLRQDFYQRAYGSDVNVHTRPGSKVILTGQYSYSDQGGDAAPSLSDPDINWRPVAHQLNKRGTNIEGANVQWGDGTTHKIFMPGTKDTVYINLHEASGRRSLLTFDYNGPVTLGAPIGGGRYHDTLAAPGAGDVVIAGTKGNDVTFAADQHYDGSTTVQKGAVLRLGSARGDGSLLTGTDRRRIVNDGTLVVRNAKKAISLSRLGGSGSLVQSGPATTTLTGPAVTYTGTTTIKQGTLALESGASLANSRAVRLTSAAARLDTSGSPLRVTSALSGTGTVKGAVTNEGVVTGGLTVTAGYTQTDKGQLVLTDSPLKAGGKVSLQGGLDLSAAGAAAEANAADSPSPQIGGDSRPSSTAPRTTPHREIRVLEHTGDGPIAGTFDGLHEGAEVKLAETVYRISYKGGDGNDVVLIATAASASAGAHGQASPGTVTADTRGTGAAEGGAFGWWPYVLAAGLLGALLFPATKRTRGGGRRRGGRRPVHGR
ncbi:autotransporter-associated beta strand repeat-containing protein [Streptomyces sp. ID05-04B]|uniref:autotransporter-associated beta strand repeat-containing protein n=1 Tax=Streptomyces sp. ID05-04B TaxID=3028661 RepID=UPI0029C42F9E|nr:autotransporter-associated beta strand repeat-containing protein [Streptomyces sp. ID05-04B]MDX5570016.1 autotransporter-associated beta strand repeat-containing protein [Streptomyces sp. ID05-04B]